MKKCLVILLLLCFTPRVLAKSACSYQEEIDYNVKAGNVKVKYEIKTEEMNVPESEDVHPGVTASDYIEIQILNVTNDFFVRLSSDEEKFEDGDFIVLPADESGIITYRLDSFNKIYHFTIEVYTTAETPCPGEKFKTYYLATPRYNELSRYSACDGIENYSLCNKYVTFTDISMDEFIKRTKDYKAGKIKDEEPEKEKNKKGILYYLNQSKWYILGGLVVIGGTVAVIEIKKTKKQRKLGL